MFFDYFDKASVICHPNLTKTGQKKNSITIQYREMLSKFNWGQENNMEHTVNERVQMKQIATVVA